MHKNIEDGVKLLKSKRDLEDTLSMFDTIVLYTGALTSTKYTRVFKIVAKRFNSAYFAAIDKNILSDDDDDYLGNSNIVYVTKAKKILYTGKIETRAFEQWLSRVYLPIPIYYEERYFPSLFDY